MPDRLNLLYDLSAAQPMGNSPVSGGGAYAERIYRELLIAIEGTDIRVKAVAEEGKRLPPDLITLTNGSLVEIYYVRNIQKDLIALIENLNPELFFSALPLRFKNIKFPDNTRFVYTIHGLRPLELIKDRYEPLFFYSLHNIVKYVITRIAPQAYIKKRKSDFQRLLDASNNRLIITVSEHSRFAIIKEYPEIGVNDIEVYYSPAERNNTLPDYNIISELGCGDKDYILLICGNRWAKNPYRALKALCNLKKKGLLKKKVVITGRGKAPYLDRYKEKDGFIITDYLSKEELIALYDRAYAFIFPTLNEGFGYPPLECMRLGTPVITSPINSLPELLQDAVLWADPKSIGEMESRILRLLNDRLLYTNLSQKGIFREKQVREKQDRDLEKLITSITI